MDPLFSTYPGFSSYLYAADNPIALLDVEGMAAGDFNTVDPPTKTAPKIGNEPMKRIPDPHRVAEGDKILRGIKWTNLLFGSNPWSLFARLMLSSTSMGTGDIPKKAPNQLRVRELVPERITSNPERDLTDEDKRAIQDRINRGVPTANDLLYQKVLNGGRNMPIQTHPFFLITSIGKEVDRTGDQYLFGEFGFISPKSNTPRIAEFMSEYHPNGETLELLSAALYIRGMTNEEGAGELTARGTSHLLDVLKDKARSEGFKFLRVQFKRTDQSSSAKPGHELDKTFQLY